MTTEVIDDYIPFWDNKIEPKRHNLCHRSTKAYPQRVRDEFDFTGGYEFYACSGATIEDMLPGNQDQENGDDPGNPQDHQNEGELPQLKHLDEDTSLVTLSIGGNDVGFAEVVRTCVTQGIKEAAGGVDPTPRYPGDISNQPQHCHEELDAEVRERIKDLEKDLVKLYNRLQREAPNARVLVVGYPRMFPENPSQTTNFIDPADQEWMNEMARLLNETIRSAADKAGVEYVKVYNALDGHELGTAEPWINSVSPELENGSFVDMGSFHPNDLGQAAIARRVKEQIRDGE